MPLPDAGAGVAAGMRLLVHSRIAALDGAAWNALIPGDYPFLRHEFLHAAETSGCVSTHTGWEPCHLALHAADGSLLAAMPLYRKSHSWGEFVFDWAWARAYARAGFEYYPKLVSASPFTPATSPRLLAGTSADAASRSAELVRGALELASTSGDSSLHVQFPMDAELPALREAGLHLRKDCQFHWHNAGYASFADFLGQFSARKRKKVNQDRRYVAEQGIRFRRLQGAALDDAAWELVHRLISITFMQRGGMPYFNLDFFRRVSAALPEHLLVVLAEHHGQPIAAAVFYVSRDTLYGRYWGAEGQYNALHFETCYYQGIEYCIEHGLCRFEPGTQGEHKISRGFQPVTTWSAHWLAQPDFFSAIGQYLDDEEQHIERYMDIVEAHSPYRKDDGPGASGKK